MCVRVSNEFHGQLNDVTCFDFLGTEKGRERKTRFLRYFFSSSSLISCRIRHTHIHSPFSRFPPRVAAKTRRRREKKRGPAIYQVDLSCHKNEKREGQAVTQQEKNFTGESFFFFSLPSSSLSFPPTLCVFLRGKREICSSFYASFKEKKRKASERKRWSSLQGTSGERERRCVEIN